MFQNIVKATKFSLIDHIYVFVHLLKIIIEMIESPALILILFDFDQDFENFENLYKMLYFVFLLFSCFKMLPKSPKIKLSQMLHQLNLPQAMDFTLPLFFLHEGTSP